MMWTGTLTPLTLMDFCRQSNVDVSVDACLVMLGIYAKAGIRGH